MFYNELDILEIRLHELYDIVDHIIIVEATTTHSGKPKPLYFNENKGRYAKYMDKIIHYITDFNEGFDFVRYIRVHNRNWFRENYQRECCQNIIKQLNLSSSDIIISTDTDEIPNRQILENIRNGSIVLRDNILYNLEMTLYYYNIELTVSRKWYHSKIFTYATMLNNALLSNMRMSSQSYNENTLLNAGWHLSYYGSVDFIKTKVESFAESCDYTEQGKSIDHLTRCYNEGILHFNQEKLVYVPLSTNTNVPLFFKADTSCD